MTLPFFNLKKKTVKKPYYHTETVTVASGSAAGLYNHEFNVPLDFNNIQGVGIITQQDGNDTHYKVGFRMAGGEVAKRVNHKLYEIDSGVEPNKKFLDFNLKVLRNNSFELLIETNILLAADLKFDVVFLCYSDSDVANYPAASSNNATNVNSAQEHPAAY